MKWTTTTALLVAAGLGALGLQRAFTPENEDPRALVERLERERRSGALDQQEALRRLTKAIDGLGLEVEPELARDLHAARARLYRAIGAHGSAREDLERILSAYPPVDLRELELEATELMTAEGQTEAALARVQRLLARSAAEDALTAGAYDLRGRLEGTLADRRRAEAQQLCRESLDEKGAKRAEVIVVEASARGVEDPRSAELLAELRAIFRTHDTAPLTRVLDLINEAGRYSRSSLEAFGRSMALAPTVDGAAAIAQHLALIDRADEAADLMLAARTLPEVRRAPTAVAVTLPLLERTGRMERAREVLATWDWTYGGDLEFYRRAATLLLKNRQLGAVGSAARGLREIGGALGVYWSGFFYAASGVLSVDLALRTNPQYEVPTQAVQAALRMLENFARNKVEEEPYSGARDETWFLLADGYRALGENEAERINLATALMSGAPSDADDWVRLAELESEGASPAWERVEARYTAALDREPKRTAELLPRWTEAGDRALVSDGLELAELLAESRLYPDGKPLRKLGPSVLWRIAKNHLAEGRFNEARSMAEQMLRTYPRLVPVLDVLIEAQLLYSSPAALTRSILHRIELVGADAVTDGFLARLKTPLTGAELMRACEIAPERFGRPTAAELAALDGDFKRAATLLDGVTAIASAPDLALQRARVRLKAGRAEDALADLEPLFERPEYAGRAALTALQAQLVRGDAGALEALVQKLVSGLFRAEARLEALELLLAAQRPELAEPLLAALDSAPDTRTPAFYSALVRHALATRDGARLQEAIERAEAYATDGVPELARVFHLVRDRRWLDLPEAVAALRAAGFTASPAEEVCLTLFEERLSFGRRLAERGVAAFPRAADWALLRAAAQALEGSPIELGPWFGPQAVAEATETLLGSRRGRHDPRELLCLLLVAERPAWHPIVLQELRLLQEQRAGALWPTWLTARIERSAGDRGAEARTLERLRKSFPAFGPAWDEHLATLRAEHRADPLAQPLAAARVARVVALGERTIEDPIELALARASNEALTGKVERAITELGQALTRERRSDFEARYALGVALTRIGQHGLAVEHLRGAAEVAPAEAAVTVADHLVDALRKAAAPDFKQRGGIAPEELSARLVAVTRLFPADPYVALAYVQYGGDALHGPSQRASRARLELTRLRREAGGRALEALRRGSTRAWIDATLQIAPELARELVESELAARPGDVDLWELAARISERFGDLARAEMLYRAVLAIEERPATLYALAELMARRQGSRGEATQFIVRADQLSKGRNGRSRFVVAQLRLREPFPVFPAIIDELEAIWNRRDSPDGSVDVLRVGTALAAAYLQWHQDLPRQQEVRASSKVERPGEQPLPDAASLIERCLKVTAELEALPSKDPYVLPLLACYRGIAERLRTDASDTRTAPK